MRFSLLLVTWCLISMSIVTVPVHSFLCPLSFSASTGTRSITRTFTLTRTLKASSTKPAEKNINSNSKINTNVVRKKKKQKPSEQFRAYMRTLPKNYRYQNKACSYVMDEELQQMENRWYETANGDNLTATVTTTDQQSTAVQRKFNRRNKPRRYYNGPAVEPDVSCYAMVANSYAKAGLGRRGAELAETVVRRCESHDSAQQPNTILWSAVLNAWAKADNWDQADKWLRHMQDTYNRTKNKAHAPDTITYTNYLEALATSKRKRPQDIAQQANQILEKMHEMADSGENEYLRPNVYTYAAVMKCQARAHNSMEKVEGLLRRLQGLYEVSGDNSVKPGSMAFMPVLNAWSRCGGGMYAAKRAQTLAEELRETYERTGDSAFMPPDGVYTALFTAYARVDKKDCREASQKVDKLLDQMENDPNIATPAVHAYTAAINAKALDGNPNASLEAEQVLRRMPKVDPIAYQCVIKAYAREGNAEKAQGLLLELEELANAKKCPRADAVTYAACIHAWRKKATIRHRQGEAAVAESAEKANALLIKIMALYREGKVNPRQRTVDPWIFNNVIHLWSTSHHIDAGEKAEEIIAMMEEMQTIDKHMYAPTNFTYIYAMDAWSTSGRGDAGERALLLLGRMEKMYPDDENFECINIRSISSALNSVTRSRVPGIAEAADKLMRRVIQLYKIGDRTTIPNSRTYTRVLRAIIGDKQEDTNSRALSLLHEIQNFSDTDDNPNVSLNAIAYNCVLNGLAKQGAVEEARELFQEMKERYKQGYTAEKPDVITFSTMIEVYINSERNDSGNQSVALLDEMEEEYMKGYTNLKPDTRFYNSVIRAWAKPSHDPDSAEKAHKVLRRMEQSFAGDASFKPDIISYTTVCQAYANSNMIDAGEKAEELLHQVEELANSGKLPHPDGYFYSAVILTYIRSKTVGSREKAEELFRHMEELYESGQEGTKPNNRIINLLISGWATSGNKNKVAKASALLQHMKTLYKAGNREVRPDRYSYNWVILAASRSPAHGAEEKRQDFQVALQNFRTLHNPESGLLPNPFTYIYFIQACKHLLPVGNDRDKLIGKAFELAKRNSVVSKKVFVQVHTAIPAVTKAALKKEGIEFDEKNESLIPTIPKEWRSRA